MHCFINRAPAEILILQVDQLGAHDWSAEFCAPMVARVPQLLGGAEKESAPAFTQAEIDVLFNHLQAVCAQCNHRDDDTINDDFWLVLRCNYWINVVDRDKLGNALACFIFGARGCHYPVDIVPGFAGEGALARYQFNHRKNQGTGGGGAVGGVSVPAPVDGAPAPSRPAGGDA